MDRPQLPTLPLPISAAPAPSFLQDQEPALKSSQTRTSCPLHSPELTILMLRTFNYRVQYQDDEALLFFPDYRGFHLDCRHRQQLLQISNLSLGQALILLKFPVGKDTSGIQIIESGKSIYSVTPGRKKFLSGEGKLLIDISDLLK